MDMVLKKSCTYTRHVHASVNRKQIVYSVQLPIYRKLNE